MEVLLTRTVDKLGEPGDRVHVAPGYARNFLLPKGLAVEPTPHNVERYRRVREERMKELQERHERAGELRETLSGAVLSFTRKVNEEGRLYSSVRPEDIGQRLSEEFEVDIEWRRIELHTPIEKPGSYSATVNLYMDITAEVGIEVHAESEVDEGAGPEAE